MSKSAVPSTNVIEVSTWAEFEDKVHWLDSLVKHDGRIDQRLDAPLFRGQGNHHCRWKLETTLERLSAELKDPAALGLLAYYRKTTVCKPALESLTDRRWPEVPEYDRFKKELGKNPYGWLDMFLNGKGIYEYWAYLRHRAFPSPLLDWTASPYVGAFFAFDNVDCAAEHVCVFAFLRGRASGSSDEHFFRVGPYMRTDKRHFLQQCWYSLCVKEVDGDYVFLPHNRVLVDKNGEQGRLLELRIPITERKAALRRLDLMNINPYSLFASEDALVRTMARRECALKEWSA